MTALHCAIAYIDGGWSRDVRLRIGADGRIATLETGVVAQPGDAVLADQALLPAMPNLHSHAFQRAMAGMTERRGASADSFWTWRELMYRFLEVLTPEDMEAIAALAQLEMLEAGYAAVAEFHYIHHGKNGQPYEDRAELSAAVFRAARATGIGLTHLPVLYSHGGAGAKPLSLGQARFGHDLEGFLRLQERLDVLLRDQPADWRLGAAPHSLRATTPDQLKTLKTALPGRPLHIHVAEQVKEVEDVQAWLGARPVEFLLNEIGMDANWCLVHATQVTEEETRAMAASGAVVGLCPVTEANLGDGIFPGPAYREAGGRYGIGTDSNVNIAVAEELRVLEYGQRLRDRARSVLADAATSTGETLYREALAGGAQALGRNCGSITTGKLADLITLDLTHPALVGLAADQILDGWIFAGGNTVIRHVWSAGRAVVQNGKHLARDRILSEYRRCRARLAALL